MTPICDGGRESFSSSDFALGLFFFIPHITVSVVVFPPSYVHSACRNKILYPLTGTLKPQSNRPLYSNTVINALTLDG